MGQGSIPPYSFVVINWKLNTYDLIKNLKLVVPKVTQKVLFFQIKIEKIIS
jgi:hypothetical protein